MNKLLMITGWAFGAESAQPLAEGLSGDFDVQVMSGAEVLKGRAVPAADYIVGWSMGGMLAMEWLPERCKGLVLLASTARFCATEGYACGVAEKALRRMIVQLKRNPEAVLTEFSRNVAFPHAAVCVTEPAAPLAELVEGLEYLLETDLRERVPTLPVPVLLMHGGADRIIPPTASDWLGATLPAATVCLVAEWGHGLPIQQSVEVAGTVRDFLLSLVF